MMDKRNNAQLVLIGLTAAVLYVCYLLLRPFTTPILFGCVIGIVFYPLHAYVKRFVHSATASAAVSTLLTLIVTMVPLAFLLVAISNELTDLYHDLAAKSGGAGGVLTQLSHVIDRAVTWINKVFHVPAVDINAMLAARLEAASASLLRAGASIATNLFSFISRSVIALVVVFFAFRDGERAVSEIMSVLPFDQKRAAELRSRVGSTITTNVYGGVIVGALQGTLTGLSFWALRMNSPVLWGVVTGMFSLVPIFGSAIVWVPAAIVLLLTGHFVKAAILLGLGAGLIGTIDNVVRPLIIHKSLRLHPIFVFFSLLGGVQLFGVLGLFVGPVVFSVAAALVLMVREDLTALEKAQITTVCPPRHSRCGYQEQYNTPFDLSSGCSPSSHRLGRKRGMNPILVVYTTREGQTRRIAEHVAANLKRQGLSVNLLEGRYVPAGLSLCGYSAVILAASVHRGKHESEMVRFVRDRRTELQQLPTALLSVSLSQAGAQDTSAPPDRRSQAVADVKSMLTTFLAETRWHPTLAVPVAGAFMYSK